MNASDDKTNKAKNKISTKNLFAEKNNSVKKNSTGGKTDKNKVDKKENGQRNLPKKTKRQDNQMSALMTNARVPYATGDIAEGKIIAVDLAAVFVDLPPFGTGIIYGREFLNSRDIIKKINKGDTITAKVISPENENGYVELSLKEARKAMVWDEAEKLAEDKTALELTIKEANKGGLILDWQGISGFLPASQLTAEHYPKVEGGDKNQILEELKALVGQKINVSILSAEPQEGKLIFTEKRGVRKEKKEIVDRYSVGDELEGEVTGIVDFGVFVKIEEGLEGLVHIYEKELGLVDDPRSFVSVGDKIKVKVIEVKDGKVSLSIKQLKSNPWKEAADRYKPGERVDGVILKYNRHGALASVEEGISGLVHVSEFDGSEEKLKETLELGKGYPFVVTVFDEKEQRMALSYKQAVGDEKEK